MASSRRQVIIDTDIGDDIDDACMQCFALLTHVRGGCTGTTLSGIGRKAYTDNLWGHFETSSTLSKAPDFRKQN